MENTIMFIVGTIVFTLYIVGYLFMVKRQNELQQQEFERRSSQTRKINTSNFNGYNIDSSIIRLRAKRKIARKLYKLTELEEISCEYSGLPSPNAYNKK
jgi:hypothetical protein